MTKWIAAIGIAMVFTTSAIADIPPGAEARRPHGLANVSLLLVAGTVVLGGIDLVAGANN